MKKLCGYLLLGVLGVLCLPLVALAQTFPPIVLTEYTAAVGVVLTAIGGIWIARKFIKLGNRS